MSVHNQADQVVNRIWHVQYGLNLKDIFMVSSFTSYLTADCSTIGPLIKNKAFVPVNISEETI